MSTVDEDPQALLRVLLYRACEQLRMTLPIDTKHNRDPPDFTVDRLLKTLIKNVHKKSSQRQTFVHFRIILGHVNFPASLPPTRRCRLQGCEG